MTVREMVEERTAEMAGDLPPSRAREILIQLTALYGNCLDEAKEADHAYSVVYSRFLDADEAANRAKIRAETTLEYVRKVEAANTLKLVLEAMRSLKDVLRSLSEEIRMTPR